MLKLPSRLMVMVLKWLKAKKYLGVTINKNMNWIERIDSVSSKISQPLGDCIIFMCQINFVQ